MAFIQLIKEQAKGRIKGLVDTIRELTKKLQNVNLDSEKTMIEKQILAYEEKIDDLVYQLYRLSEEDIDVVKESLK